VALSHERLAPGSADTGLSAAEAVARLRAVGPNELPQPRRRPLWWRFAAQLREPMALLLIAAAAVSGVALGERLDAVAIGVIVLLNAGIATAQEQRAARALAALERLQTPLARLRRDGVVRQIPAVEVVPGDVVLMAAGEQAPADLHLLRSVSLQVDESLLTGESVVVDKQADVRDDFGPVEPPSRVFDQPGWVFSGTLVTHGSGEGVAAATGPDTALGRIALTLRQTLPPPTPLQRELAVLTRRLGVVAVSIAAGVFLLILARTGLSVEWLERSFLSAVALAVAAVPEGLATVTLVALAVGVRRMAGSGAIVRRIAAVESLGAATVIVTDKTGTITLNSMRVEAVADATGVFVPPTELPPFLRDAVHEVSVLCSDATLDPPTGDPTEIALLRAAGSATVDDLRARTPRSAALDFDAARRRMSVVHPHGSGWRLLAKGAPEAILPRCLRALASGGERDLHDDERLALSAAAGRRAGQGMRLLALARRDLAQPPLDVAAAEEHLTFVALVALADPVRDDAAQTLAEAAGAGLRILMATGDHAATATAVARQIGLADDTTLCLTGDQLRAAFPTDPLATAVYARVDPEQKLALVEALQERGEVVAMTGDGVNDVPALHRADIGVALGASGSDVARAAADMVITDDSLATIVAAVREGRGIYDNIRKVIDYLVAGNLSEIAVVVGALLLFPQLGLPLLPLQLLWINLLTDGLPALALGLDRNDPTLMRRPPRPRRSSLLDRGRILQLTGRGAVMAAACLATLPVTLWVWDHEPAHARSVLLASLVTAHLLYAFVARQPDCGRAWPAAGDGAGPPTLLIMTVLSGLLLHALVTTWPPAQAVFGLATLTWPDVLLVGLAAAAALAGTALVRRRGRRRAGPMVPIRH
jgi:P-type Ca2+ transporter type 2C